MGLPTPGASTGDQFSLIQAPALVALGAIVLLLGLVVVAALILMRMRHRRVDAPRRSAEVTQLDPWREAGRRMKEGK